MSFDNVFHFDLTGADCLIVGGGKVAFRKAGSLIAGDTRVTVVAPKLAADFTRLPEEGYDWIARKFLPSDLAGRQFVFAATDDRALNKTIAQACRDNHIPVNVADSRSNSTFIVPAVLQKGDLTVSVATNGKNPGYSRALKSYLDDVLDDRLLEALAVWSDVRETIKARVPDQSERERILRSVQLAELVAALENESKDNVYRKVIKCLLL